MMPLAISSVRRRPQAWGGSTLLPGSYRRLGRYAPVLALTVLKRGAHGPMILVGVRDPLANKTHQNVASVPTRRVQTAVAGRWRRQLRWCGERSVRDRTDLHEVISNILSRKLGLADAQERDQVRFAVSGFAAAQGVSVIGELPDGRPLTETLTMFNACVLIEEGADLIPAATASYRPLVWAELGAFVEMTNRRDPGRLNAGLEGAFACAYGLCLQTSLRMLRHIANDAPGRPRQA
jgi:hypothetical protein